MLTTIAAPVIDAGMISGVVFLAGSVVDEDKCTVVIVLCSWTEVGVIIWVGLVATKQGCS